MSRIRTVKPEFWTSEQILECSPLARLAFIGMWNFCDDHGVHPASYKTLKAEVFPGDDITAAAVQGLINELLKHDLIAEFSAEGRSWWFVTGWHHQLINRPTKSRYPLPPRHAPLPKAAGPDADQDRKQPETTINHGALTEDSLRTHGALTEDSLQEGKGKEGKGREEKSISAQAPDTQPAVPASLATETAATTEADAIADSEFTAFWNAYPPRSGGNPRLAALKAWKVRRKDGHAADRMIAGAMAYADYCRVTGKLQTEFVKQASTFLNQLGFLEDWNAPAVPRGGRPPRPRVNHGDSRISEAESILQNLAKPPLEGVAYVAH